jgi:hypothetical protein
MADGNLVPATRARECTPRRGALAVKGRETRGTTALAIAVFAARVTVSILMISAIPKD